jgi:hypothetical protein
LIVALLQKIRPMGWQPCAFWRVNRAMFAVPGSEAAAESAASPLVTPRPSGICSGDASEGQESLFQLVEGDLCLFGIDPPALHRSLALFERGRKLFIGISSIISHRSKVFP